ncbi:hypothetical protein [Pedobacter sp. SYSU D00535]|uniref:hypothetical protein n=1 Tax=Pedobacter sp. SYSU D00535 TaxID=2810308 RepID=UPI001A958F57|nr:hypothetical protein [Pedobacter sp. SYSU D00535]
MKQFLLTIAVASSVLFSCKEEQGLAEKSEKKVNVTFAVSDFSEEIVNYGKTARTSAAGDTLLNYASRLEYHVYDSVGMFVKSIVQDSTASNFGQIEDQLSAGQYTLYFAAFRGNGYVSLHLPYFMPRGDWYDTFVKKMSLTVGSQDIEQQVRLARIVSAIEVTLTDPIPVNTSKLELLVSNEADSYSLEREEPVISANTTKSKTFLLSRDDENKTGKKLFMYVGNTAEPVSVTIRAYNATNQVIAEKVVTSVTTVKNKMTLLRGRLFTPTGSPMANFSVTVSPEWLAPSDPILF